MNKYQFGGGKEWWLEEKVFPGEEITHVRYQVMDVVN